MPAGQGLRARTRHSFARDFRTHGYINLTTYLRSYKACLHFFFHPLSAGSLSWSRRRWATMSTWL